MLSGTELFTFACLAESAEAAAAWVLRLVLHSMQLYESYSYFILKVEVLLIVFKDKSCINELNLTSILID